MSNWFTKHLFINKRLKVFLHAFAFVLGFSLVFIIVWGGSATILGQAFYSYKSVIAKIGGVVVIIFGLYTLGILKIPWLAYDTRPEFTNGRKNGLTTSALMGVFFAAGWSPCVGPVLGAILALGVSAQSSGQAIVLASGYALGLGIPFLLIGLGMERTTNFVHRFQRHLHKVQIASGVLLIGIGILLLTDQLTLIAIWAERNGFYVDLSLDVGDAPTYFIALLAGLVSFLSPCVLPLVPAYIGYLSGHAFPPEAQENI